MKRRKFIRNTAIGLGVAAIPKSVGAAAMNNLIRHAGGSPLVISSGNGFEAAAKAMEMIQNGSDAIDAVIAGVNIVEDDPNDTTVGFGGLPNEDGIVELDSCCMHGPTHNAGAVASIRNIKNPSKVAKLVMERTDHVLLVGEGALRFAKAHGFKEENLLTDKAREIWLKWKETLNDKDNWFAPGQNEFPTMQEKAKGMTGTITCIAIDKNSNISGVTTTSGLAFKIPGRVGDSPIIGAGLYVDNEVGACGSTGRGEENLKNLSCFLAVEEMRKGADPEKACEEAVNRIVHHAKVPTILNKKGLPNFNVSFYALNKNGAFGAASLYGPITYVAHNGETNQKLQGKYLYEWSKMSD